MPSSAVRTFTDPDQYATAVRAVVARVAALGRGTFSAKLTRIDLHDLWMQRFADSLPRVALAEAMPGRAIIEFATGEGGAPVECGFDLGGDRIVRFSERQSSVQHSSGPTSFASMSLPIDKLEAVGAALGGAALLPPAETMAVRPPPAALARLRRLHAAASTLAEHNPAAIAHPATAMTLEQELVQAMAACLVPGEPGGDIAANRRHGRIMRRFHELLEAGAEERLHIVDLCARLGVSDRTLRACCQEYVGMPPHRYLWMRQMTIARRALLRADPAAATVTDVATANGFWELGRFAVGYRRLFGESPSASLRRPPPG